MHPALDVRNHLIARRAKKHGMRNSLRIVLEARRAGLPLSLAFAIVEQETSNGANVWGGDPPPNGGTSALHGQTVTRNAYVAYRGRRGPSGRGGMQGVGPLQLTYFAFQDEADRLGGCWKPACNIRVGFTGLAGLVKQHGLHDGVRAYNGAGPAAEAYAHSVVSERMPRWHSRLA